MQCIRDKWQKEQFSMRLTAVVTVYSSSSKSSDVELTTVKASDCMWQYTEMAARDL